MAATVGAHILHTFRTCFAYGNMRYMYKYLRCGHNSLYLFERILFTVLDIRKR